MTATERNARRSVLSLESLDDRIAMSWAGVPPSVITPTGAVAVTLNSQAAASGAATINGNEVDYFSFTATRTGSHTFNATTPNSSMDPVLGVFNGSNQRIAYNDDITTTNTDSRVTVNLTAGQRYTIGVTNYSGTPGGSYSWSVQGPAASGTDDRFENNDTRTTATAFGTLTGRQTFSGLVMADSADWFSFTTTRPGTSTDYVLINFLHSQGDLDLALYNSVGTRVALSEGVGNSERLSLNGLAAGTYYVHVYGFRGVSNPSYTLEFDAP